MIATHPIGEIIGSHPLFRAAGEDVALLLASCAQNVVFHPGAMIMKEGDPADRFLLIRAGRVALEMAIPGRGKVVVDTAKAGEALGLSWLVPPYSVDFDARAVDTVRAVSFDAACLRAKCESDPRVGYTFYKLLMPTLVGRLRSARVQMLDLYAPVAETKPA